MLESMMVAERSEFLSERQGNKGNGYRLGHTYGHDRRLEFRYVALAVTGEGKREVLGVLYMPEESATGWGGISGKLKERGVRKIGLMAADLRDIFRTGQRDYTLETTWAKWQEMCDSWGKSASKREQSPYHSPTAPQKHKIFTRYENLLITLHHYLKVNRL